MGKRKKKNNTNNMLNTVADFGTATKKVETDERGVVQEMGAWRMARRCNEGRKTLALDASFCDGAMEEVPVEVAGHCKAEDRMESRGHLWE